MSTTTLVPDPPVAPVSPAEPEPPARRERDLTVDLLRAVAIVAVAVGHWMVVVPGYEDGRFDGVNALATVPADPARQQVVLYLGDGESTAGTSPLTEAARVELGGRMEQAGVSFFAVPLGLKVNAHNLHGFAALTGV